MAATGLVQVHEKYKGRGVQFVSLAGESREAVELFAEHFSVPWPCGYGATPQILSRFGAHTGQKQYGVWPTLYLIGPDGRVVWSDGGARPSHRIDPNNLAHELDEHIEHALDNLADAD